MKEDRLYLILRLILGIIFLWASWDKIIDPQGFAKVVRNYDILPNVLANCVALILPWIEAICGILLISGCMVKGSCFIIDILMIIFILAIISNLFRGIDMSCGCFSNKLTPATKWDYFFEIVRDFVILGMGLWVLFFKIKTDNLKAQESAIQGMNIGGYRL